MKNSLFFILLAVFMVQCTGEKQADKRILLWSDEFEYSGAPDSVIWVCEEGYLRNKEMQKYTNSPENVSVNDGVMTIVCRLEADSTVTSASVTTKHKKEIKYGRVEVRAKIPSALGTWPAIWLLGNNISEVGWPACGEIDIMEHVGYDNTKIYGSVHTKAYNHVLGNGKNQILEVEAPWEDYHIYAIDWSEKKIDFFYDDSLYFTYENDGLGNKDSWPFDTPHYLLINLAYGGTWGASQGVNLDALPLEYKIDYVRVYK